jgi:hypothetical protein
VLLIRDRQGWAARMLHDLVVLGLGAAVSAAGQLVRMAGCCVLSHEGWGHSTDW